MPSREVPLPGGNVGGAVRVGDTVRRNTGPWTPAVHALLRHLERVGFGAAPRALGIDERNREVLSYIEGETVGDSNPWPGWWRRESALVQAAELLRGYHEAVSTFHPPDGSIWRLRPGALQPGRVICHSDWGPYNVVWRGDRIVGVVDWDLAYPGDPLDDLAFAAWHWAPLHHPGMLVDGPLGPWDPDREARLRLLVDIYGLSDRQGFVERVVDRIRSSADTIGWAAANGDRGMQRLRDRGVVDDVRRSADWVSAHAAGLQRALE